MKAAILSLFILFTWPVIGQIRIDGRISDVATGDPVTGADIRTVVSKMQAHTDGKGRFSLDLAYPDTLWISHVGYSDIRLAVTTPSADLHIALERITGTIEEVQVSTGYYRIPRERATGSFVHLDNTALNRSMGGNILQRLEGMVSGVQFVDPGVGSTSAIRVRGLSTIESDETPLVVLDNFPYEGDIGNIDPNSIESITVLKDAAASSIWGARAGNGVIVITSKRATEGQHPKVSFSSNFGMSDRPDLTYGREWLSSPTVMAIEKERFGLGHYTFGDNENISLYVDYLKQHADGIIDDSELQDIESRLATIDTRREAMELLYRSAAYGQYALNLTGSSGRHSYTMNVGYQGSRSDVVGNDGKRTTIGLRHSFRPIDALNIGVGLDYAGRRSSGDGIAYSGLMQGSRISPYLQLQDGNGNAMAVPQAGLRPYYAAQAEANGLQDWLFRPLEERELHRNRSISNELRLNTDVRAKLMARMSFSLQYQYTKGTARSEVHYLKDSYHVRNLVNTFTQSNGTLVIPNNGIYRNNNPQEDFSHYGRAQLDYGTTLNGRHRISSLAGVEIRHAQTEQLPGSVLYNYEEDYLTGTNLFNFNQSYATRPAGTNQRIPGASPNHRLYIHRDLSYYANGSYEFDRRYILSGSVRWDGSNLFGVKTNQKGVPLWSVGGSWNIGSEPFYGLGDILPYLRLRGTYGIAGNVNKTVTHYPTILFGTSYLGLTSAMLRSIGNPSLRWEKVRTVNIALDWRALGNRISGSIERYVKNGNDLIGEDYLDPTLGITEGYKINYADIRTEGWDIQLSTSNLTGGLSWKTDILAHWVNNEVTNYRTNDNLAVSNYFYGIAPPTVGRSRDVVYAIPWHGLSGQTGLPVIYMDGAQSGDYKTYFLQYLDKDMLVDMGSFVPTVYGTLRNTLGWKGVEFSAMLGWKSGYVFRRTSMGSSDEYADRYHQDYDRRWQQAGDENWTDVPRHVPLEEADTYRDASSVYMNSEALITRGDHIRLQDITLSYTLPAGITGKLALKNVRLYAYARNLGILWKSNRVGIDPDYANSLYRAPKAYSAGIQFNF